MRRQFWIRELVSGRPRVLFAQASSGAMQVPIPGPVSAAGPTPRLSVAGGGLGGTTPKFEPRRFAIFVRPRRQLGRPAFRPPPPQPPSAHDPQFVLSRPP